MTSAICKNEEDHESDGCIDLQLESHCLFGSFGYANMSLYDRHLSLVSLLLASASVDSSLKV